MILISSCSFQKDLQRNTDVAFAYKNKQSKIECPEENVTLYSNGTFSSNIEYYALNYYHSNSMGKWKINGSKLTLNSEEKYNTGIIDNIEERVDTTIKNYYFHIIDVTTNVPIYECGIYPNINYPKENSDTSSFFQIMNGEGAVECGRIYDFSIYSVSDKVQGYYELKDSCSNVFFVKVRPYNMNYYYFEDRTFTIINSKKILIRENGCKKVFKLQIPLQIPPKKQKKRVEYLDYPPAPKWGSIHISK